MLEENHSRISVGVCAIL